MDRFTVCRQCVGKKNVDREGETFLKCQLYTITGQVYSVQAGCRKKAGDREWDVSQMSAIYARESELQDMFTVCWQCVGKRMEMGSGMFLKCQLYAQESELQDMFTVCRQCVGKMDVDKEGELSQMSVVCKEKLITGQVYSVQAECRKKDVDE
jgi:hypothetical protein